MYPAPATRPEGEHINSHNILYPFADPSGDQRVVHRVEVDALDVADEKVDDLAQAVGHAGVEKRLLVVLIA